MLGNRGIILICALAAIFLISSVAAQDAAKATVSADSSKHMMGMEKPKVGGLKEFHDVLRPVWHSYLPDGNFKAVRESMPAFMEGLQKVMTAELPMFYQHVKVQYDDARQNLAIAVAKMDTIARGGSDSLLAAAAEEMHSAFEQAARVLAPRMKELEKFHLVLYPLWHEALPNDSFEAIKAAMPDLKAKMDSLVAAVIPDWFKEKETKIIEKREALNKAVNNLIAVCHSGKNEEIKANLTEMHERFMALDNLFE